MYLSVRAEVTPHVMFSLSLLKDHQPTTGDILGHAEVRGSRLDRGTVVDDARRDDGRHSLYKSAGINLELEFLEEKVHS